MRELHSRKKRYLSKMQYLRRDHWLFLKKEAREMRRDNKVSWRSLESIIDLARNFRTVSHVDDVERINVGSVIQRNWQALTGNEDAKIDRRVLHPSVGPAWVEFSPTRLVVDDEIWKLSAMNDPDASYILAHELGHLHMHDKYAKGFTSNAQRYIGWVQDEESAEWQAHAFARHFLVPQSFSDLPISDEDLALRLAAPIHAVKAVRNDWKNQSRQAVFSRSLCSNCGEAVTTLFNKKQSCVVCGDSV